MNQTPRRRPGEGDARSVAGETVADDLRGSRGTRRFGSGIGDRIAHAARHIARADDAQSDIGFCEWESKALAPDAYGRLARVIRSGTWAAEETREGRNHADLSLAPRHEAINQRLDSVQYARDVDRDGPVSRIEGFDSQVVLVERYPEHWQPAGRRDAHRRMPSTRVPLRTGRWCRRSRRALSLPWSGRHLQPQTAAWRHGPSGQERAGSSIVDGQGLPDATRSASDDAGGMFSCWGRCLEMIVTLRVLDHAIMLADSALTDGRKAGRDPRRLLFDVTGLLHWYAFFSDPSGIKGWLKSCFPRRLFSRTSAWSSWRGRLAATNYSGWMATHCVISRIRCGVGRR